MSNVSTVTFYLFHLWSFGSCTKSGHCRSPPCSLPGPVAKHLETCGESRSWAHCSDRLMKLRVLLGTQNIRISTAQITDPSPSNPSHPPTAAPFPLTPQPTHVRRGGRAEVLPLLRRQRCAGQRDIEGKGQRDRRTMTGLVFRGAGPVFDAATRRSEEQNEYITPLGPR